MVILGVARSIGGPLASKTLIAYNTPHVLIQLHRRQLSSVSVRGSIPHFKSFACLSAQGDSSMPKDHATRPIESLPMNLETVRDTYSSVDLLWDESFSEHADEPLDLSECSLEAHENRGIPQIINALHHFSLRNKQLRLVLDRKSKPTWLRAGAAISDHPVLKTMFLESPARWLRGERRLVQRIRSSPIPEWSTDEDENATQVNDIGPAHFELGRRYALRGIAGNGAFAKVGWGIAVATGEELAFKRVPDVLPDRVAARRLMREVPPAAARAQCMLRIRIVRILAYGTRARERGSEEARESERANERAREFER